MSKEKRSGKPPNEIIRDYTVSVKQRALNEESEFFMVTTIALKPKLKVYGVIRRDKPFYCVMVRVNQSNLPVPTMLYNPVFKMKRLDLKDPFAPKKQQYIGITSPEDFFTLPDFTNTVNADEDENGKLVIKEYYADSIFTQYFDSAKDANFFIDQLLDDLRLFLLELANFIKEKDFWEMLDWEGSYLAGVTKGWSDHKKEFVQPFVASFMEKVGGVKHLVTEDGKELPKGA